MVVVDLDTTDKEQLSELQYNSLSMLVKVHVRIRSFVVTCMYTVFLQNLPIAILELPNCLSREWLTFLKRCYWLVRQE